jgi:hypothetical protein
MAQHIAVPAMLLFAGRVAEFFPHFAEKNVMFDTACYSSRDNLSVPPHHRCKAIDYGFDLYCGLCSRLAFIPCYSFCKNNLILFI